MNTPILDALRDTHLDLYQRRVNWNAAEGKFFLICNPHHPDFDGFDLMKLAYEVCPIDHEQRIMLFDIPNLKAVNYILHEVQDHYFEGHFKDLKHGSVIFMDLTVLAKLEEELTSIASYPPLAQIKIDPIDPEALEPVWKMTIQMYGFTYQIVPLTSKGERAQFDSLIWVPDISQPQNNLK